MPNLTNPSILPSLPSLPASTPAAEYMTLPASQYSVLDAQRIERLDEDTFRCYVGGLKLFSLEVEPVITVSVTVQERGPTVRLLSTKVGARAGGSRGRLAGGEWEQEWMGGRVGGLVAVAGCLSGWVSRQADEVLGKAGPSAKVHEPDPCASTCTAAC